MWQTWGTIFMIIGLVVGVFNLIVACIAIAQRRSFSEVLGLDDVQRSRLVPIVLITTALFFVMFSYFIKDTDPHRELPPDINTLGSTHQILRAPEIDTAEQLVPKQQEAVRATLPEVNRSTDERDKEINDYIEKAIRRSRGPDH